ncbi:MAG: hypothetical protein PUI46_02970 [Lachnospiraceae bacterium]|nr:hypothetical protein [Lachnospiraceae bacterium]MDY5700525.1 hypothetical protein [Lachnospiraceae bacterium]
MKKKREKIFILILLLFVIFLCSGCRKEKQGMEAGNLVDKIQEYKGYIRVVEQEEYDFYTYFVKRDLAEETGPEEMEKKVQEYANEVNAVFYLGNRLNLCEPYSFELLQMRMEQENNRRKIKLEKGEVVYGLEEFTLQSYFQYEMDNLKMNIRKFMEEHVDNEIRKKAKDYYNTNPVLFQRREAVTYEVIRGKERERVTANRQQLDFMGKADKGLGDFLETAEPEDTYEDVQNGEKREILLKEIQYSQEGFEHNEEAVLYTYIEKELYPSLIRMVAQNNPVEFRLD